jgi:hypothetical protein
VEGKMEATLGWKPTLGSGTKANVQSWTCVKTFYHAELWKAKEALLASGNSFRQLGL